MPCGATTSSGDDCSRPEGWGRDTDEGPCRDHADKSDGSDRNVGQRAAREAADESGRSDDFNEVAERRILESVREGSTLQMAARSAGISPRTLRRWRDRYPDFDRKVQRAKAEAGERALGVIQEAADKGDWRAASWWLEKRFPEQYGETDDLPEEEVREFTEAVRSTIRECFDECDTADELILEIGKALEEMTDG